MRVAAVDRASRSRDASASNAAANSTAGMASAATLGASTPSKRCVYSSTAASPRSRTSDRIATTAVSTPASSGESNAVRRASAASKPWADESSRRNSTIRALHRRCRGDRFEERLHSCPFELEGGGIDDQAGADRQDLFDHDQIVGPEGIAGAHEVDDCVRKPYQRREFHRAVEPDQIDVHALARKMLACRRDILGRHLEPRAALYRACVVERARGRDNHVTDSDAKIDGLIETLAAMLEQYVLARNAQVGRTVCHVRR